MKYAIRKNDTVIVRTGASKGTKAKVLKVLAATGMVLLDGVNVKKKHIRSQRGDAKKLGGSIIDKSFPIHISNVALLDPKTGKPTRVGVRVDSKGNKVRVAKKSDQVI